MILMKRNLKPIHYCLYRGQELAYDDDGYETGEPEIKYDDPVEIRVSVSPASGYAQTGLFGNLTHYDKVIITDNMNCPIDENTVLYVDAPLTDSPDYRVRKVAKALNYISYAISEIKMSDEENY